MNILAEIALKTQERVEKEKNIKSLDEIKKEAEQMKIYDSFTFEKALRKSDISFICEVKKASPSKGIIAENFDYLKIAKEYETSGADAISVLTEPFYFKGDNRFLSEIAKNVSIPLLRKDFVVDEYMIYEAKLLGASGVLFICALLDTNKLKEYIKIAHSLGLSALVEAHTKEEIIMAIEAGARIIGVNNRDLKTFTVDISISSNLRPHVPSEIIFVSESGIETKKDVEHLRLSGVNAVLIGETLMRSDNKKEMIENLRGECRG